MRDTAVDEMGRTVFQNMGQVRWLQDIEQASSFSRTEAREVYQHANAAGLSVTIEGIF